MNKFVKVASLGLAVVFIAGSTSNVLAAPVGRGNGNGKGRRVQNRTQQATVQTTRQYQNANKLAEVLAKLTGKPVETIVKEKIDGNTTFGKLAEKYGVLDGFKAEMLNAKKAILDERVKAGTLTQEKANEILKALEENMKNCNGDGTAKLF